jgi:hypothetical protein
MLEDTPAYRHRGAGRRASSGVVTRFPADVEMNLSGDAARSAGWWRLDTVTRDDERG